MPYRFAAQETSYSDFSSGRVFYSSPGAPAFPVRLVSEIFQRAAAFLDPHSRISIYDPTCGGAYHLAALGILHGQRICSISASDVSEKAVELATRNLGLLTPDGLDRREAEIRALLERFGKDSHREALESLQTLRERITKIPAIERLVFQANALIPAEIKQGLQGVTVDLVIADVPYGHLSDWNIPDEMKPQSASPVWMILNVLRSSLTDNSVVAIAADKSQKIAHENYARIEHFKLGKRQVSLLKLK